ncbi:MAG: repressor LexA [Gammaproteobacteria bacterium]|jgi:repressor LexA
MPLRKPNLTRRQQEIHEFLCENAHGFAHPPTLDELAATLGLKSRGSLHKQIQALIDAGLIEPMNRTRRGIRLTSYAPDPASTPSSTLPMLGRIAAGRPIQAIEDDQRIDVPANLKSGDNCFVLQVQGDSMIEDGIFDGDWIVVEPCQQASNGAMVVAMVDGSEATVKRLLQRPGEVVLIPANSAMAPIHLAPDRVQIQGVVVGQMRSYR